MRSLSFIVVLVLLAQVAPAKDERSIKDLTKGLLALGRDVDPAEAQAVSTTAHTTARKLAKDYRVVLNPEFTVFLVNIGMRKRGWCGHWAQDIGAQLKELNLKTLVLHWGVAFDKTSSENNCIVVTARNQRFEDGMIIDGWRRAGRLFWCRVVKDDEYEMEQHYGRSGITMWRENMQWSAWLQDQGDTEEPKFPQPTPDARDATNKPKEATVSRRAASPADLASPPCELGVKDSDAQAQR